MDSYGSILISTTKKDRVKVSKWISTITLIIMALITWILTKFASSNPVIVEKLYSSTLYPYIGKGIGFISNIFPFSLGEIFLMMLVALVIISVVLIILKPRIFINNINRVFHWVVRFLAISYILFYFLWGFNYYRMDYMDLTNMNYESGTIEDLKELSIEIINNLNNIRVNLFEDADGVFFIEDNFQDLSIQAQRGFDDFMVGTLNLDGNYGRAKPILLSRRLSYTGIMGIYFPFTSEANINTDIPHHDLLSTISHEMAHQHGFAKEEEANFIAYKASINNPDERFKYSGYYLAMKHLMNEVYMEDPEVYHYLFTIISDGVKRDMNSGRDYWKSKEGKVEEVTTTMNDNYLKANNQEQGIRSYNEVVRLLLSEYKSMKGNE